MKTRILITALMITSATCVIAETNTFKSEDSLFTSHLAYINGSVSSESDDMHVLNHNFSELNSSVGAFENIVNLKEWIESRELWEQENSEMVTGYNSMETVNLEEWISSRESWEQENTATELTNESLESIQEEWINDRETWEQK